MPIPKALQDIIDEIKGCDDEQLRLEILIEFGENFKEVPETLATRPFPKENLVPGCESEAYVFPVQGDDNSLRFEFAVENPQGISAKAMAAILKEGTRGASIKDIAEISDQIAFDIFGTGLSMGKGVGLTAMVRMVRDHAAQTIRKKSTE